MKSDLITVLKKFSPEDNKQFSLFLKNEYLCRNKNCYEFFNELHKYYPLYVIDQKQKEIIYRHLYPAKEFNESTFRSLVRSLMISVEDYLLIEDIRENSSEREVKLLKILNDKNAADVVSKKLEDIKSIISKDNNGDISKKFLYLYDYEIFRYNYFDANMKVLHKDEADDTFVYMNNANSHLSLFYFVEIVSNFVNYKIQQGMYDNHIEELDVIFLSADLKRLDVLFECTEYEYAYRLYKYLYLLYSEKTSKTSFLRYKSFFLEHTGQLSKKELLQHNNMLISYCIKNKNLIPELADELWGLYQFYLSKELYEADNNHYLDTYLFRSIIFLGLRHGYFSEVKLIIDKFSTKLHPEDSFNLKNLGYAYYYSYTGELKKSMEFANKVKLNDYVFKYDIKNLFVKLYFEDGSFDQLTSTIRCYREFLRNDKLLNQEIKNSFKQYINFTEQLLKQMDNADNIELNYTLDKLQKAPNVYAKDWLEKMYKSVIRKSAYVLS